MEYLCKSKTGMVSPVKFRNYNDACEYGPDSVWAKDPVLQLHITHDELIGWVAWLHDHIDRVCAGLSNPDDAEIATRVLDDYDSSCFHESPDPILLRESLAREASVALRYGFLDQAQFAIEAYEKLNDNEMDHP